MDNTNNVVLFCVLTEIVTRVLVCSCYKSQVLPRAFLRALFAPLARINEAFLPWTGFNLWFALFVFCLVYTVCNFKRGYGWVKRI
jgi:hypothetical protein